MKRLLPGLLISISTLSLWGQTPADPRALRVQQTGAQPGRQEVRVALVIGNDRYRHVDPLRNACADARAMASRLEGTGFQVLLRTDVDEKGMKEALRTFKNRIRGGDVAVFYFSGHGLQLGGSNLLLPVDIKDESEDQVRDDAIPLQRVLDDLQEQKAKFSLAIVDACRNNPFKGSGRSIGGRGLAPTTAATGQMVLFSAGTGQEALDRLGPDDADPNGLFTRVLLEEMRKPGLPVDRLLRNVREEVVRLARSAGHEQVPALYDQALGEFYFIPGLLVPSVSDPAGRAPATVPIETIDFKQVTVLSRPPAPHYPPSARRARLTGKCVLEVTIDENGLPVTVSHGEGHPIFIAVATRYLLQWRFTPIELAGTKRKCRFRLTMPFNLKEGLQNIEIKGDNRSDRGSLATIPENAYNDGIELFNSSEIEMARPFFVKALALNSNYVLAEYMLGLLDIRDGAFASAKAHLQRYLDGSVDAKPNTQLHRQDADSVLKDLDSLGL